MVREIQSKQEFISLALDSYRNRLVSMNLQISIAGLSLALSTTIAGFFGMNVIQLFKFHFQKMALYNGTLYSKNALNFVNLD